MLRLALNLADSIIEVKYESCGPLSKMAPSRLTFHFFTIPHMRMGVILSVKILFVDQSNRIVFYPKTHIEVLFQNIFYSFDFSEESIPRPMPWRIQKSWLCNSKSNQAQYFFTFWATTADQSGATNNYLILYKNNYPHPDSWVKFFNNDPCPAGPNNKVFVQFRNGFIVKVPLTNGISKGFFWKEIIYGKWALPESFANSLPFSFKFLYWTFPVLFFEMVKCRLSLVFYLCMRHTASFKCSCEGLHYTYHN